MRAAHYGRPNYPTGMVWADYQPAPRPAMSGASARAKQPFRLRSAAGRSPSSRTGQTSPVPPRNRTREFCAKAKSSARRTSRSPSLDHPAPHGLVVTTQRIAVTVLAASPELGLIRAALAVDRPDVFGQAILGNGAHHTPPDAFTEQRPRFAEPDAPAAVADSDLCGRGFVGGWKPSAPTEAGGIVSRLRSRGTGKASIGGSAPDENIVPVEAQQSQIGDGIVYASRSA